jgi:hypothetical protein
MRHAAPLDPQLHGGSVWIVAGAVMSWSWSGESTPLLSSGTSGSASRSCSAHLRREMALSAFVLALLTTIHLRTVPYSGSPSCERGSELSVGGNVGVRRLLPRRPAWFSQATLG